jgi:hypothetical protein
MTNQNIIRFFITVIARNAAVKRMLSLILNLLIVIGARKT